MLSSSNILVMRNAILKASKNLRRDFGELEKLQNSKSNIKNFVENSYQNTQDALLADLKGARPDWVFYVKKNSTGSVVVILISMSCDYWLFCTMDNLVM